MRYPGKFTVSAAFLTFGFLASGPASFSQHGNGAEPITGRKFQNDICLPQKLYLLDGVQNNIFTEPLMKRWRPYDDVVRFSGTAEYTRRLQRVASITAPVQGASVTLDLVNQDEFKTVRTLSSLVQVGRPGAGNDTVRVSIIGDSFTHGAFFKDALLVQGYVPKIKMIGLREVNGHPGQFDEGRGGWSLKTYFSVSNQRTQAYNGFWQPDGRNRYWGSTAFWQLVKKLKTEPGSEWSFGERYNAERFTGNANLFDDRNGLKLNPEKGDLMYDNQAGHYILYDGSGWKKTAYEGFNWRFDYGKYLSMWRLQQPRILAVFLGLNDFRSSPDPANIDFTEWNSRLDQVISSYLEAVPEGKFVVMIPSSSCGILDNKAGDFTTKQNASMWEVRKNIIEHFDNRESRHIYVVDAGIAIDNLNGTRFLSDTTYTLPYTGYTGSDSIAVQTGNPHPYLSYPVMGISLAAFIQFHRAK